MDGTKIKITFYFDSGTKASTIVQIGDLCTEDEDGNYVGNFEDQKVVFRSIEAFALVIRSGISSTINSYYDKDPDTEDIVENILEFGEMIVPISKISGVKVQSIFEDEIPEENYVTVEELED